MTALSPDMPAPPGKGRSPERRDPAWRGRLAGAVVALLLLWPMLVLTEFKPWLLLAPDALKPSLRFLADFVPPRLDAEFLALVARETWRTVAIATAGLTLALVLAVPLALLSVRVLSIHIAFLEMIIDPVCSLAFEAEEDERRRRPGLQPDACVGGHLGGHPGRCGEAQQLVEQGVIGRHDQGRSHGESVARPRCRRRDSDA